MSPSCSTTSRSARARTLLTMSLVRTAWPVHTTLSRVLVVYAVLLACGLGVPIPEDITLVAGGYTVYLAQVHDLGSPQLVPMIVIGMLGELRPGRLLRRARQGVVSAGCSWRKRSTSRTMARRCRSTRSGWAGSTAYLDLKPAEERFTNLDDETAGFNLGPIQGDASEDGDEAARRPGLFVY